MRLKITRRIRTNTSEQWTLFDVERRDAQGEMENIGKMDLHYDEEMVYATLLLWSEFTASVGEETTKAIIDDLMEEATAPIGVPALYTVDFFTTSLQDYKFYTNDDEFDDDEDDDDNDDDDEDDDDDKPATNGNRSSW